MGILAVILVLVMYWQTKKNCKLIDDPVPRGGYLWVVPEKRIDPKVYEERWSWVGWATNVWVYVGVCVGVWMNWGWEASVLYAVYPVNVCGVAWLTGNYYMTSGLFVVVSYWMATHYGAMGGIGSAVFYQAGLHSTLSALPYGFLVFFINKEWWVGVGHLVLMGVFLNGKRFKYGVSLRKKRHENIGVEAGKFKISNFFIMVKVIGYYIKLAIFPYRLGFFHDFGKYDYVKRDLDKPNKLFWLSLALVISFALLAFKVNAQGFLIFFLFIGIYSQFTTLGQFIAERYTLIANIGWCVILATLLKGHPVLLAIVATLYFCKSLEYIPAYRHNKRLFTYSIASFPYAPENYVNYSSYLLEQGDYWGAMRPLQCAIEFGLGNKDKLYNNMANCCIAVRQYDKGAYWTKMAIDTTTDKFMKDKLTTQYFNLNQKIRKANRLIKQLSEV